MNKDISYSVAIRTLGTAGEKYEKLMNSIKSQNIQPEKIIVVLPYGYTVPQYQLGSEKFVFCEKGMVRQRIEALKYIDSDYTLFCDDDVEFENGFIEKLAEPIIDYGYSCSAGPLLSFFPPNTPKYWLSSIIGGACVMINGRKSNYVRILKTGGWSYSYDIDLKKHLFYNTESFAWTCFMASTDSSKKIHFSDELWCEKNGFAAFEDRVFSYKMSVNDFKCCIVSDAKYIHNDGKTSVASVKLEPIYAGAFNHYVFWHRFIYLLQKNSFSKLKSRVAINYYICMSTLHSLIELGFKKKTFEAHKALLQGFRDAKKYVKSSEYLNLNNVYCK